MTRKRPPSPAVPQPNRSRSTAIPTYWSPEQAAAVLEFLDELREHVLGHYGVQIQEFLRNDRVTTTPFTYTDIDERDVPF